MIGSGAVVLYKDVGWSAGDRVLRTADAEARESFGPLPLPQRRAARDWLAYPRRNPINIATLQLAGIINLTHHIVHIYTSSISAAISWCAPHP